jgi:hypothetical protein
VNEHLDLVRSELGTGSVTAQSLVLLFRAAEEAEDARDVPALEECLSLATQAVRLADGALRPEAERLTGLCEERLGRLVGDRAPVESRELCEACGRELQSSAVRCRACGTLLV